VSRYINATFFNDTRSYYSVKVTRGYKVVIIRLEAKLRPNIGFTLRSNLAVFTRSAATPPKVNRFEVQPDGPTWKSSKPELET